MNASENLLKNFKEWENTILVCPLANEDENADAEELEELQGMIGGVPCGSVPRTSHPTAIGLITAFP